MRQPETDPASERTVVAHRRIRTGPLLVGSGALCGLFLLGRHLGASIPEFALWVDSLEGWGPVLFIIGYAVAVAAFVPGSLLTLAAGAIFGLAEGVVYVFIAAVLASSAAFLVSRHLARAAIERKLAGNVRFMAIERAVRAQGRKIVFLLRLSPVFPFTLLNYALGLTSVRFVDYLVASVGMLPGTFLYVYSGKLVGDVTALAGEAAVEKGAGYYVIVALGLLATLVVTTILTRIARQALQQATSA